MLPMTKPINVTTDARKAQNQVKAMAEEADAGARQPRGIVEKIILMTALFWSLFQLWYASPLPFIFEFGIFNNTEARAIHLAFAVFLAFLICPASKTSPRDRVPVIDGVLAVMASGSALYLYFFFEELANRAGAAITSDLIAAAIGMVLLLEATRRALGPPLMIVALLFLVYVFGGQYMPDVLAHKGASFSKAMSHFWITTEGVFGVALGVSTGFVFLFVLFGSLLDRAGAGYYFIQLAFSMLGHLKGGPAKAAVVSSGLSGLISGSSIANVVTTGTFTIPLMKRVGFSGSKAGAIEVAASTNGQVTPPIMGAAAFLMVEYVGVSYLDVVKAAILPALISYIALYYIVHLEAVKSGMEGLPRRTAKRSLLSGLLLLSATIFALSALTLIVYFGIGWIKVWLGSSAGWMIAAIIFAVYMILIRVASKMPHNILEKHEEQAIVEMPPIKETLLGGLHFLLPIVVLVWCVAVERLSPGLSALWATVTMIFIMVTQKPFLVLFCKSMPVYEAFVLGCHDLLYGMVAGARNMVGIAVATAAAGIVVGAVTLTGIGFVMTDFVSLVSGDSMLLMLIFTAVISLLLGMGLPTTANYIVVSSLMAPVIVELGAQHGLLVPLISVHLFVFYFGILADATPPVGLASFAAAAIARDNPIKTGVQAFIYNIRTAILPFMFIFNSQLLLINVNSVFELLMVVTTSLIAMLAFASATMGFWLTRLRWYEVIGLLLITLTLFRPGIWWDKIWPEFNEVNSKEIYHLLETAREDDLVRFRVSGDNLDGDHIAKTVQLPVGNAGDAQVRLMDMGIELYENQDGIYIDNVVYGSEASKAGIDFDWKIEYLEVPNERPDKQWMYIPALFLLLGIYSVQRRRLNT